MALFFRRGSRWVSGYENSNNQLKQKARGGRWEEGKGGKSLFSLPPSHRAPRTLFLFLPSLPTTQRRLCAGESDYGQNWTVIALAQEKISRRPEGSVCFSVDRLRLVFASLPCSMSTTNTFFSGPEQSMKSIIDGNR